MEYYNRGHDAEFNRFCQAIDTAKMIEVCSTKLPQLVIPKVLGDPRFKSYREETNQNIGKRSKVSAGILGGIPEITFNETYGAFYITIIFRKGVLRSDQKMKIDHPKIKELIEQWVNKDIPADKRFVYYLLGAKGVCVVPISSFCSELSGFRVTLLEEDPVALQDTFTRIREGIIEYLLS